MRASRSAASTASPSIRRDHKAVIPFALLLVILETACRPETDGASQRPAETAGSEDGPAPGLLGAELRVMSFNIVWVADGKAEQGGSTSWVRRRALVFDVVREYAPDIVGLQEVAPWQLSELLQAIPSLAAYESNHESNPPNLNSLAILYRRDRFVVDEAASRGAERVELPQKDWGPGSVRVPNWVRLVEKDSGQAFYFYDVHHDHRSPESRAWSVRNLSRRISARKHPDPVVVVGDFNAAPRSPSILYIEGEGTIGEGQKNPIPLIDSFRLFHPDAGEASTYHGFAWWHAFRNRRIDYIFVTHGTKVLEAEIVRTSANGIYPSDHFPVTAKIRLPIGP